LRAYYDRRAREYDDWWLETGLFADRKRPGLEAETEALVATIAALAPALTVDVACGTGFLTRHLPGEVVGLDQSENMLAVAQEQVPAAQFVQGDALALPFPNDSFERVFASYFYCHLEQDDRQQFLTEARRVAPELVVVASRWDEDQPRERREERILNDGSRWEVFKRVFEPEQLADELGGGDVLFAGRWFVAVRSAGT